MQSNINYQQQIGVENVVIFTFKYVYRADFLLSSTATSESGRGGAEESAPFLTSPLPSLNCLSSLCVINNVPRDCQYFYVFLFVSRSRDNWSTCWFLSLRYWKSDTYKKRLLLGRVPAASTLDMD